MTWRESRTLLDLHDGLNAKSIVDVALAIEGTRQEASEAELLAFHGFNVAGLTTTPFMYQAALCARDAGCVAYNGLERCFLPVPDDWVHPTLRLEDYSCQLERDRLNSSKSWPYRHDCPMGDFQPNASPKWWSHGLVHALLGFGFWSRLSEWDVMLMARLGEAVASLHWYWLAELGREYCPIHTVASGDSTPDCNACRQLEAQAHFPENRGKRLEAEGAEGIAANLLDILKYESIAFQHGRERGEILKPDTRYLDLGEAGDYALFHHRRLESEAMASYVETCLRPGVDYARSLDEFEERAVALLKDLLSPRPLGGINAPARARRVLQDLGARVAQWTAATSSNTHVLGLVGDALTSISDEMTLEDADATVAATIQALASAIGPESGGLFQLGYAPTMDRRAEPEVSRDSRKAAYIRRLDASQSPLRHFIPRATFVLDNLIHTPRTAALMQEAFVAGMDQADPEDMNELMTEALIGWINVASESWGPDNATAHIGDQWYYRIAHRSLPPEKDWPRVRLRPNPYVDAIPAVLDIEWIDKMMRDNELPLKPRHATRVGYILVGQGRKHPLFIPFTRKRKRLLNALQETPSVTELLEQGFPIEDLDEAIQEELVIALQHDDPFTLYVGQMPEHALATASLKPVMAQLPSSGGAGQPNPWDDLDQAAYYEEFCQRSSLYGDLADATIAFAEFPKDGRVADLGCGTGESSRAVLRHGCQELLAIDPSPRMISALSRLTSDPRMSLHLGDAGHLVRITGGQPLDALLCNSAFWLDPTMAQAMGSVASALIPGGKFGLSIPAEYLGHADHRTTKEAEIFYSAVTQARATLGVEFEPTPDIPHSGLLGSADVFLNALEAAGFKKAEHTLWRHPWSAGDYLDWLAQPTLLKAMAPGLEAEGRQRFLDTIREAIDTDMPLESHWFLVRATK